MSKNNYLDDELQDLDEATRQKILARMWMDANDEKWGRGDGDHFVCLVDESEVPDYVLAYMKRLNDDIDAVDRMFESINKRR